ncbi:hypothetical protein Glove_402g69 [Diversispora epigaea]|uniref:NADH dehydrogenase [ubiquinone] 1 beta subcomplex subunit 2 n=1 Tax=Diversispora epigaea TaxID=1348612 RepID=A0A397GZE5_9GLOM|nr:hypothetical protein Glove_402g69 [Diversispora epigaea]
MAVSPFPHPGKGYVFMSKLLGGTMLFWMLYRGKKDGAVVLGLRHPWEHGEHGHGNGHNGNNETHHH